MLYVEDVISNAGLIPNVETFEPISGDGLSLPGTIKISDFFPTIPDLPGNKPITFKIENKPHKFQVPLVFSAVLGLDYQSWNHPPSLPLSVLYFINEYDPAGYDVWESNVVADNQTEFPEGTAFEIVEFKSGDSDVMLDTDRNFWQLLIEEPTVSVNEIQSNININVFPTIFDSALNIELKGLSAANSNLKRIEFYDMKGHQCLSITPNITSNQIFELELTPLTQRGAYLMKFIFEDGYAVKRIFKL